MTIDVNKKQVYEILAAWQDSLTDLDPKIEAIYVAAMVLLIGYAKRDKDVEKLCSNLWLIWEEHRDAVQGM